MKREFSHTFSLLMHLTHLSSYVSFEVVIIFQFDGDYCGGLHLFQFRGVARRDCCVLCGYAITLVPLALPLGCLIIHSFCYSEFGISTFLFLSSYDMMVRGTSALSRRNNDTVVVAKKQEIIIVINDYCCCQSDHSSFIY